MPQKALVSVLVDRYRAKHNNYISNKK